MLRFLWRLVEESWLGVAIGLALLLLPWSGTERILTGIGAVLIVCSLGKGLYDSLFYDHYRP